MVKQTSSHWEGGKGCRDKIKMARYEATQIILDVFKSLIYAVVCSRIDVSDLTGVTPRSTWDLPKLLQGYHRKRRLLTRQLN